MTLCAVHKTEKEESGKERGRRAVDGSENQKHAGQACFANASRIHRPPNTVANLALTTHLFPHTFLSQIVHWDTIQWCYMVLQNVEEPMWLVLIIKKLNQNFLLCWACLGFMPGIQYKQLQRESVRSQTLKCDGSVDWLEPSSRTHLQGHWWTSSVLIFL